MPMNDKLPILEPVPGDRKNGVSVFVLIAAIMVWSLGGVLTAFAGLAYANVGSFMDIFIEVFPEGMMLTDIVLLGIKVFLGGMLLMALSEVIKLLQRISSSTYTIRYLDQVIPQTVSVEGLDLSQAVSDMRRGNNNSSWNPEDSADPKPVFRAGSDQAPISITVNVNTASAEVDTGDGIRRCLTEKKVAGPAVETGAEEEENH